MADLNNQLLISFLAIIFKLCTDAPYIFKMCTCIFFVKIAFFLNLDILFWFTTCTTGWQVCIINFFYNFKAISLKLWASAPDILKMYIWVLGKTIFDRILAISNFESLCVLAKFDNSLKLSNWNLIQMLQIYWRSNCAFSNRPNSYLTFFILSFAHSLYSVALKFSRLVTDILKISPRAFLKCKSGEEVGWEWGTDKTRRHIFFVWVWIQ